MCLCQHCGILLFFLKLISAPILLVSIWQPSVLQIIDTIITFRLLFLVPLMNYNMYILKMKDYIYKNSQHKQITAEIWNAFSSGSEPVKIVMIIVYLNLKYNITLFHILFFYIYKIIYCFTIKNLIYMMNSITSTLVRIIIFLFTWLNRDSQKFERVRLKTYLKLVNNDWTLMIFSRYVFYVFYCGKIVIT